MDERMAPSRSTQVLYIVFWDGDARGGLGETCVLRPRCASVVPLAELTADRAKWDWEVYGASGHCLEELSRYAPLGRPTTSDRGEDNQGSTSRGSNDEPTLDHHGE